jgi:hypothetical protein
VRRLVNLPLALLLLVVLPGQAFAHGLGQSQDLPLPFWLYLFAAAAVVLVSFVQIVLLVGERHTSYRYPRFNLLQVGPLRAVLTNGPFLLGLRLLSVALFLLVILSGLLGRQGPGYNFAPTFVWIIWWVGLGFFTAFVGNIWPLVNPWKVLFEWTEGLARRLGTGKGLELGETYPAALGVWPALVLFAVFIWVENVFAGSATPLNIALFALLYSLLTWTGMVVFGKEVWLRRGEAFSVFYDIIARFAPTEVRVIDPETCRNCGADCRTDEGGCVNCYECFARATPEARELNLRPPVVGLSSPERVTLDRVVFVVFVLASVTFDSLLGTPPWVELQRLTSMPQTLGVVAVPLFFLAVYLVFVKLSQLFSGGFVPFGRFATAYVYSLVPIAIAYQAAHYYTFLFIQGQAIIALISDPFGWGWDLFGTADYKINAGLIGADTVWYTQVALIVAGHVVAVYLAHVIALRLLKGDTRLAARSQYPMLGLMILYTVFSLWILSQPIVEERKNEATLESAPPQPAPTTQNAPPPTIPQPPMPQPSVQRTP